VKFLHAADLHLDSPLRGLERYEGAPVENLRGATRRALENLVDFCLAEEVALLLIAGDLYDGDWRDYSTALFFAAQMARLRKADIQVVWVRGNHDAASRITRHLQLPGNVVELSTRRPQTLVFEELGVAVHGQGFAKRAVTEDLAASYPVAIPGLLNVGLLHTCATGREGHESYAPCAVQTLVSKGYEYWALGHVHAREVLCEDPWIVFPGNLQGRHAREIGAKGATLVRAEAGRVVDVAHQVLDAVRWCVAEIDASAAVSADDVVDLARTRLALEMTNAEGRPIAARVRVTGASRAHDELMSDVERWQNALRAIGMDLAVDGIWIEKILLQTDPHASAWQLAERHDALAQLVRSLREARQDDAQLADLAGLFNELRGKLPPELREGEAATRLDGPEEIREALVDVERILLPRLLATGRRS
jgi:DNA repair exonuclease SbcCD nuclease subunit